MYETIYVPVDNSDHSNQAISTAIELGRSFHSKMVGCHVYAARMHDYRFKQMEFTLPDEYLDEVELERQRKIHDSLITMGLKLISESYLTPMDERCQEAGLEFEPRMIDGKHSTELIRDVQAVPCDLVVMGALGMGRTRHSQIGSVVERVARHSSRDLMIVKRLRNGKNNGADVTDTILVGIDGSPQSFGALVTAIEIAKRTGRKVEAIAVYDPYLHYSVFNGLVDVLTEKAAKVFRFEEQNQLHEEIIDTGLAEIYQSHLDVAESVARGYGVEIKKTLLDGKAFPKVLDHVEKTNPSLLVLGRIGIHGSPEEAGLGSNTENLVRLCPCDVLLTTRLERPELDVKAEEMIRWTPEAEARFQRVPSLVRGIARTATHRLAIEKGHSVVTNSVLDEAMDRYMPKRAARATEKLAESLVLESSKSRNISICKKCGVAATEADPVKCTVCDGTSFQVVTPEMVEEIIRMEGGAEEEVTYDGRKLTWTQDARNALKTMTDAYKRRRAKARVEKSARMRRMSTVTLEFAREIVEEETGEPLALPGRDGNGDSAPVTDDRRLIARDEKQNPLFSSFDWTEDAVARVLRVPPGFMRNRTQERIELLAREQGRRAIDLDLVEQGIEFGRAMMAEMIEGYRKDPQKGREQNAAPAPAPVTSADAESSGPNGAPPLNEVDPASRLGASRRGGPSGG